MGMVYVPNTGTKKMNDAVSVIAIVLLIALLFVGMKMMDDENGFYKLDKSIDWTPGYVDLNNGLGVADDVGFFGNLKNDRTYGMFTAERIPIDKGLKIERVFTSKLEYQVLLYDEYDTYLGVLAVPESDLLVVDYDVSLTGEQNKAKYIRIFAYPTGVSLDEFGKPVSMEFTKQQWMRCKHDIVIYKNMSDIKDEWNKIF